MVSGVPVPAIRKKAAFDLEKLIPLKEVVTILASAFLVRRALIEDIGSFDEDFFSYYEEYDWCPRTIFHGYTILQTPNVAIYHSGGGETTGITKLLRSSKRED